MGAGRYDSNRRGLGTRLLWFVGLWLGGVIAVGSIALLIRSALL